MRSSSTILPVGYAGSRQAVGQGRIVHAGRRSSGRGDTRSHRRVHGEGLSPGPRSLKAAVDKLHAAGIKAGLHPYAFFIDKSCPWVTPVPDKRLAKDASLTLAADLSAGATRVPTVESTEKMSAVTGF